MDINGNVLNQGGSGANQQLNTDSDVQFGQITVRDYTFPTDTPSSGQIIKESNGSLIWTQDDGGVLPQALATTDKPTFAGLTISDNIKPYNLPGTGGVQGDLIQIQADNLNTSFVPTEDLFGQDLSQSGDVGFNTITSSQTVFTNDNEVVTKKYVDERPGEFGLIKVSKDLPPKPTSLTWNSSIYPYTSVNFINPETAQFILSTNKRQIVTNETIYPHDIAVGGEVGCWIKITGRTNGNLALGIKFVNSKSQWEGAAVGFVQGVFAHNQDGKYVEDGVIKTGGSSFSFSGDRLFQVKVINDGSANYKLDVRVSSNLSGGPFSNNLTLSKIPNSFEFAGFSFCVIDWAPLENKMDVIELTNFFDTNYTPTDIEYRIQIDDEQKLAITDEGNFEIITMNTNQIDIAEPFQCGGNIKGFSKDFVQSLGCIFSLFRACPADDLTTTTAYQDMVSTVSNPWNTKGTLTFPARFLGDIDFITIEITGVYTVAASTTCGIKLIIKEVAKTLVERTSITLNAGTDVPFFIDFNACLTRRSGDFKLNEWLSSVRFETENAVVIQPGIKVTAVSNEGPNTIMPQIKAQAAVVFEPRIVNVTYTSSL